MMLLNDRLQQTTAEPAEWSLTNWSNVINYVNDRSFEIWRCRRRSSWTKPKISVNRSFEIRCCCLRPNCTKPSISATWSFQIRYCRLRSNFCRDLRRPLIQTEVTPMSNYRNADTVPLLFELIKQYRCAHTVTPPCDYFIVGPALRARYAMVADVGPSSVRCSCCGHISKTKQDRPILTIEHAVLGSWHRCYCFPIQILSRSTFVEIFWYKIQNTFNY